MTEQTEKTIPTVNGASPFAVHKTVTVNAPIAHAFRVFTEGLGSWWPLDTHHIGKAAAATAVIEPYVGGRWYERGVDGTECVWGKVLAWEPPHRLVLAWQITADWRYDLTLETEVEVTFVAEGPGRTRLELEHRHLDRYRDQAGTMRSIFDSEGGWTGILVRFATAAEGRELKSEVPCSADQYQGGKVPT
jgi:uncharacterized protein YndB with AHSA1/START domain